MQFLCSAIIFRVRDWVYAMLLNKDWFIAMLRHWNLHKFFEVSRTRLFRRKKRKEFRVSRETQKRKKKSHRVGTDESSCCENRRNLRILGISPLAHVDVINCLSGLAARKSLRSSSSISPRRQFSRANCSISAISSLRPTQSKSELKLLQNLFFPNCLRRNAGSRPNDNFIAFASSFRIFLQLFRSRANISRKCRGKTSSRVEMWINRKSAIFARRKKNWGSDVNENAKSK